MMSREKCGKVPNCPPRFLAVFFSHVMKGRRAALSGDEGICLLQEDMVEGLSKLPDRFCGLFFSVGQRTSRTPVPSGFV